MTYDYLPYAIVEGYCFLFTVIILSQLNSSIGSEHEVRLLKDMIYTYLVLLASDIVYALVEGGHLVMGTFLYTIDNAIVIFAISLGCYFWFRFVEDRLHQTHTFSKVYHYLLLVPIALIFVLDVCSIFTGWLFYIDEGNHYQSTGLFEIQAIVNIGYAVIPTVDSIIQVFRTHSRLHRVEYAIYAIYLLAPLSASWFEDIIPTIPVMSLNIFVVILLLFLTLQNLQIYNDALTSLNNRRRLNQYLEEQFSTVSADKPLILFMLDLNRFKAINDRYGHIEGDNALRSFATALRIAASKYDAFIARYGGDEFCLVTDSFPHAPEEIRASIEEALREVQSAPKADQTTKTAQTPYEISSSMGYAICDTPGSNIDSFIAEADAALYDDKKRWHLEHYEPRP